jgi:hypothetical protein
MIRLSIVAVTRAKLRYRSDRWDAKIDARLHQFVTVR